MMKLSDYIVEFIAKLGVKHVFMLPGGGAMHLNDSLGRHPELKYVCNLHEQASAIAAEAYAQLTGKLGVVMVTTGPGATNTVTGVAGAWLESTPVLFISGQVKSSDLVGKRGVRQIGFQEIDIVSIVRSITKYAITVRTASRILEHLEEAVWHATHGRKGPVWIDIPLDLQATEIDPDQLKGFEKPLQEAGHAEPARSAATHCLDLLASAERPVVLAGNGVRHAGAIDDFLHWAELIELPILTTWKALDFLPENHPLFVGRPGAVGQRAANFAQQTSDLFISLGARLDFGQTAYNHENFAPKAKRVIVDVDPKEIAKLQMKIALPFAGDAGVFIRELLVQSHGCKLPDWSSWRDHCQKLKLRYPIILPEYRSVTQGVHNYVLVERLGQALGEGDILVPGSSGACSEVTCQALQVQTGLRCLNTQGLGAMGFGLSAALGASLASGGCRTVCIDGDGGFAMNNQELATVFRLNLPIKFFVLNNGGYSSIRATQINYFESRFVACDPSSGLTLPDLKKVAESSGIAYRRISTHSELNENLKEILEMAGPIICDVIMAPGQFTQPKVSSKQQGNGRMVTMPMEDLWPFLEREELEENLVVCARNNET